MHCITRRKLNTTASYAVAKVGANVDRIDLFRVFARVVECANFTRAADTLGLRRSSVSAAI